MAVASLIIALGGYDVKAWHVAVTVGAAVVLVGAFIAFGGIGLLRRGWARFRAMSTAKQAGSVALLVLAIAGAAYGIYKAVDRPGDVYNADVGFEEEKKPKKPKPVEKVDWPVYGYDDARTRFLETRRVNPPYHSADWSFVAGTLLEFSPVLHKDTLYIVDKNARTIALNSENGRRLWTKDVGGLSAASPAFADGRLFVVTLEPGSVSALDPKDGKVLWTRGLGARSETSPVVYGNTVIVGNESGTVFALDVKSGKTKWSIDTAGPVKGGIALEGGIAYFGNYAGQLYAVRADDGSVKWQSGTQGSSFGTVGRIYSTPAVAYGRVFVGSIDSRVYSFDADNGDLAWSQSTGDWVYSAPAVAEVPGGPPTVYIGSKDKYLYALDAETGAVRWKKFTGGILLGAPSVIGDIVYVGVIGPKNGTIGYNADSGREVFRHELGEYNPATSDGDKLYLTGASNLRAFRPITEREQREAREAKKRRKERKAEERAQKRADKAAEAEAEE
jgi:outer membrane protein assembly factor BamB